ncbi:MAG: hypothetical protein ABSD67_15810 [Terracidiphilus sp.]|jgi:hypothetical protein
MSDTFQRLFTMSEAQPLALNAQAALNLVRPPHRSQLSWLIRHFLERFFNHETASPDGDAKTRLVQIAAATGLPGLMVAVYLWPVYHPFPHWPPGRHWSGGTPPYWLQVNHHFFFVLYSFVVMGIITVFEWDMFFPDLLDIFVLTTLPVPDRRLFLARVAAITILIAGFLFNVNMLAPLALPAATDPPNLLRFLAGHLLAVFASGLFAAVFVLALQAVLVSLLGERLFRRLSLFLQGFSIAVLLMLLFLFPVLSGVVPFFLQSNSPYTLYCPPFWFLGIYQRLLEGPTALPVYVRLAQIGYAALLITIAAAVVAYPVAYLRRVRQLIEGPGTRDTRNVIAHPFSAFLHVTLVRHPVRRAVFHFISQTLLRVPRYRIYLVLCGGIGFSVVAASILRFTVTHNHIRLEISADGMRASIGIIAFWIVAGLRMAFLASGNKQGSWVFRIVHGKPPRFLTAMEEFLAAKIWVFLCGITVTLAACVAFHAFAPPELLPWPVIAGQLLIVLGMCVLLTDVLFLNVRIVPFTGDAAREQPNLAFTVLKYFAFLPVVVSLPLAIAPWIETSGLHYFLVGTVIAAAHLLLRHSYRRVLLEHCNLLHLEDDEEEFPMSLGLRY